MKNRLRVLRAERGWSQADLAERLEVSRQSVNAIETGKYDPRCLWRSELHGCSRAVSRRSSRTRCERRASRDVKQIPSLRCGMTNKKDRQQQKRNAGVPPLRCSR